MDRLNQEVGNGDLSRSQILVYDDRDFVPQVVNRKPYITTGRAIRWTSYAAALAIIGEMASGGGLFTGEEEPKIEDQPLRLLNLLPEAQDDSVAAN